MYVIMLESLVEFNMQFLVCMEPQDGRHVFLEQANIKHDEYFINVHTGRVCMLDNVLSLPYL
jgi:hypothetical protein